MTTRSSGSANAAGVARRCRSSRTTRARNCSTRWSSKMITVPVTQVVRVFDFYLVYVMGAGVVAGIA